MKNAIITAAMTIALVLAGPASAKEKKNQPAPVVARAAVTTPAPKIEKKVKQKKQDQRKGQHFLMKEQNFVGF